jgi:uncharacterized protein YecE (DUF72 family)
MGRGSILLKNLNRKIKIGTCAWSFDDWRGNFYPEKLPQNQWLAWYARALPAVEIDSTFYATPSPQTIGHWLDATPDDFYFTCKMPREITHERRLRDCGEPLRAFLDGIAPLRAKLGPILIQLPPTFTPPHDEAALKDFLFNLPRDFSFAVEFRDPAWHLPRIVKLFEEERICWVWADTSPLAEQNRAPFEFLPQTADCLYVRLLGDLRTRSRSDGGSEHRYGKLMWPRDSALESWAIKIEKHLADTGCVYIYANNHYEGFSPLTCQRIAKRFRIDITLPEPELPVEESAGAQLDLL